MCALVCRCVCLERGVCVQGCVCGGVHVCAEVSLNSTMEGQSVKLLCPGSVDKLSTKGSSTSTCAVKVPGTPLGKQWLGLSHRTAKKLPNTACQVKGACVLPLRELLLMNI